MAEQYRQPYLDSSVFIAWIKGEVRGDVDRKAIVNHILHLAERGNYQVFISALTLAEVHKGHGNNHAAQDRQDQDEQVLQFFENDYIQVIDINRQIGEDANRFCRQYGLSPADAIHLACALHAGCDVLLAWDDGLTRIQHPEIRIEEPQIVGQVALPLDC